MKINEVRAFVLEYPDGTLMGDIFYWGALYRPEVLGQVLFFKSEERALAYYKMFKKHIGPQPIVKQVMLTEVTENA